MISVAACEGTVIRDCKVGVAFHRWLFMQTAKCNTRPKLPRTGTFLFVQISEAEHVYFYN